MKNSRLDYYLSEIGVDQNLSEHSSTDILLQENGITAQKQDDMGEKYQKKPNLKGISSRVAIAGGIMTAVQFADILYKSGIGLGSIQSLSEFTSAIENMDLENLVHLTTLATSGLSFLDSIDQLGNTVELAVHATDAIEAAATFGLSIAASYLAKKTFDKINLENEEKLSALLVQNKYLNQAHFILNKEYSQKKRKAKLKLITPNILAKKLLA